MANIRVLSAFCATLLSLLFLAAALPAGAQVQSVVFHTAFPKPWQHLLNVTMEVRQAKAGSFADLVLPVWTPGSYLVREFSRNVQNFEAVDAQGKPLPWTKTNKNTWRITLGGRKTFTARYRVFANELSVRTSEVSERHAFLCNAGLLMYVAGNLQVPVTLSVAAPAGWKVASSLPAVPSQTNTFRAPNYDILYDSPVCAAPFDQINFSVRGIPHRVILDGTGDYDKARIQTDLTKLVEAEAKTMGGLPYRDYTFFVLLRERGGGGLEHLNSCVLGVSPTGFKPNPRTGRDPYPGFLSLSAHEFFHLWNVKRIRPDALGPFDYTQENYTRLLWVAEGITDYYGSVHVRRAGFSSARGFLDSWANNIESLDATPGRHAMSLEEASLDAWVKQYRPSENSVNDQVSYYLKGGIVGLLLDLTIRQRTEGKRSLDDVMRTLLAEFAQKNRNYTPADFQRVCERTAGGSLDTFFAKSVRGRADLDYNAALAGVGLTLKTAPEGELPPLADIGGSYVGTAAGLTVRSLAEGTPAYEQGLAVGDLLLSADETPLQTLPDLGKYLQGKKPGEVAAFTIQREGETRVIKITLGAYKYTDYRIVPVANPTDAQKKRFAEWLGAPFADAAPAPPG